LPITALDTSHFCVCVDSVYATYFERHPYNRLFCWSLNSAVHYLGCWRSFPRPLSGALITTCLVVQRQKQFDTVTPHWLQLSRSGSDGAKPPIDEHTWARCPPSGRPR